MESAWGLTPGMCIDDVVLLIDIVIIYKPPESAGGFLFLTDAHGQQDDIKKNNI